ncbi:MAG: ATPase, T2SS/T4P/T4SS family [Phycisphaerales bacterium]
MGASLADSIVLFASTPLTLVSWWKPLILLVTLGAWGWIVSTIYDKHAARWNLARQKYNSIHLCCGLAAVLVPLLVPIKGELAFWIGWVAMLVILGVDLFWYPQVANKDARVPAAHRIEFAKLGKMLSEKKAKKGQKGSAEVRLTMRLPDKTTVPAPPAESPELQVRLAAEDLFFKAMAARATQVELGLASKDGSYKAEMLVDGVKTPGDTLPGPVAIKVIDLWKQAAKLDQNERRKRCMGDTTAEMGSSKWKVRVTTIGVTGGMKMTLLMDPDKAVKRKPDDLGLLPEQLAEMKILTGQTTKTPPPDEAPIPDAVKLGVVLLAAPPDAGRTTTMYSVLQMHDAYTNSIQTVEMEQQLAMEGVKHTLFDPNVEGADFATSVRSILRRDPDIVAIGECPDATTAKEVAKVDAERSRVYLSLKASGALEAVDLYMRAVGDNAQCAKTLRGVVAQRLVRRLCTNCKVGYPPGPDMLKKMGVASGEKVQQLFKKGGQVIDPKQSKEPITCPQCGGTGYVGQEGCFEVYRIDDEEKKCIAEGDVNALRAAMRKRGQPTIQQAAIRKAVAGISSVEEVQRIAAPTAPPTSAAAPAAKPAAPAA